MARGNGIKPMTDPPIAHTISGSIPGVLDSKQPSRLIRFANAKLSFASFDPFTALAQEVTDLHKLSLNEERYRPRRVVIETVPTGESFWRFVPSASKEEGVTDEGHWPRLIEICGQLVECTQEQWDIYKLDPMYECCVKNVPALSTISRVIPKSPKPPLQSQSGKRIASESPTPDVGAAEEKPRKRVHMEAVESSSERDNGVYEEEEVEEMVIDVDMVQPKRSTSLNANSKFKEIKEDKLNQRQSRREKLARRAERLTRREDPRFEFLDRTDSHPDDLPQESYTKRKVNSMRASLKAQENQKDTFTDEEEYDYLRNTVNYAPAKHFKRTRTVSPSAAKRNLEYKRFERERLKRGRRELELAARREEMENRFLSEIFSKNPDLRDSSTQDIPNNLDSDMHNTTAEPQDYDEAENIEPEERERQAAIAESRLKLAELEADRPLWEEQAKKRMARKKAEEEDRRAKCEFRRQEEARKAEAERIAKQQREEQEAQNREEALRRERDESARQEREKRQRQQRWSFGPWTVKRALERYKALSETFDITKFSDKEPLTTDAVPWPTLQSPTTFVMEDVDWAAVEIFFETVRLHMRPQDYKTLLEKSHRRFHPDRWRSRSLLKTVVDDAERGCMEVAANTVAQALTPLWRSHTGR